MLHVYVLQGEDWVICLGDLNMEIVLDMGRWSRYRVEVGGGEYRERVEEERESNRPDHDIVCLYVRI